MAGVFHVEFGINDTDLTEALEATDYPKAERLIKNRAVASYLDEGCYQRIPLFIVLCGGKEETNVPMPRNLYLARLLIEYGASVNYRVPQTYLGCEYMGPGKTALCLLVDFHINISRSLQDTSDLRYLGSDAAFDDPWLQFNPYKTVVVGLNKQLLYKPQDILEDIEDLIFTLLSNGADPNLTDRLRRSCLHRTALFGQKMELLTLLADNGANINATDCNLNTPLLSLCDITHIHKIDQFAENDQNCFKSCCLSPEEAAKPVMVKPDFLHYFLSRTDVEINAVNRLAQSALFLSVIRGDADACWELLQAGADPSQRGSVFPSRFEKWTFSPLLVSFLSVPVQRSLQWLAHMGEMRAEAPRRFAHLVDAEFFNTKEIEDELMAIISESFPEFLHFHPMRSQLIPLMAGSTTATLKQLAARTIFKQTLIENPEVCMAKLHSNLTLQEEFTGNGLSHDLDAYEKYIFCALSSVTLKRLTERLSLPKNALINFEIELFLRRLSIFVGACKPVQPYSEDSDSFDSDLDSSLEGDSDLEYW
ncbi:uncharacterized protein LOC135462572 [Liolophura sinensis]|uniref:uncharacterized protein LOC135462572 n=1 Tax=Liolophura sinensis TaxID=3198878 RepID=UPI00315821E7